MSLHEPILPVNAESDTPGGADVMLKELNEFLKGYPFVNRDNLKKIFK